MAENATMKIDIPGVDFGQLAREAIAVRLTEALVGADDAIRKVVVAAMEKKVTADGRVSNYSNENNTPYVEWLAQDLVRAATKQVLAEKIESLRPAVTKAIEAALRRSIKPAALALVETFIKDTKSAYHVDVQVNFKPLQR